MEDPSAPTAATWDNTVYGPPGRGASRRRGTPIEAGSDEPAQPKKKAAPKRPTAKVDQQAPSEKRAPKMATTRPGGETQEESLLEQIEQVAESPAALIATEAGAAPGETEAKPAETTALPVETTALPAETTALPVETTAMPAETGAVPAEPDFERSSLWVRLVADPGSAPEHLIGEAVRTLGPDAKAWVVRMRERYPQARPDALAHLATEEHVRTVRTQAMANTTAIGSWTEVGLLARTQASLVLTIAAVYDLDPTAEERSRDLMELLPMPRLTQPSVEAASSVGRLLGAIAVRRMAARLLPFGAAVAAVIHSGRTTRYVAMRSIDRFRQGP